jgi:hypothetical protein
MAPAPEQIMAPARHPHQNKSWHPHPHQNNHGINHGTRTRTNHGITHGTRTRTTWYRADLRPWMTAEQHDTEGRCKLPMQPTRPGPPAPDSFGPRRGPEPPPSRPPTRTPANHTIDHAPAPVSADAALLLGLESMVERRSHDDPRRIYSHLKAPRLDLHRPVTRSIAPLRLMHPARVSEGPTRRARQAEPGI